MTTAAETAYKSWGQIAYEAYAANCGGKSIRGDDLPTWNDQDPAIRGHWQAAGLAVKRAYQSGKEET